MVSVKPLSKSEIKTNPCVVLHHQDDGKCLNDEMHELLHILGRPLPLNTLREANFLETFPVDFRQKIEHERLVAANVENLDVRPDNLRPVTEILDLVLTSVALMRASGRCLHGFNERKSIWILLLTACGLAMSEEVFVRYETLLLDLAATQIG